MRTFGSVHALVQLLDGSFESVPLPRIFLRENADLDDIRKTLCDGPLGTVERDIFFPSWTKSLHVLKGPCESHISLTAAEVDERKITIETSEQLQNLLDAEMETPGITTIVLQQCRSKRYSRRKEDLEKNHASVTGSLSNHCNVKLEGSTSPKSVFGNNHQHNNNNHFHHHTNRTPYKHHQNGQKICKKRNCHPSEQPFSPLPVPHFVTAPQSALPQSFESDQPIYFYPEPFSPVQYNLLPSQALLSPMYAIPWNIGCYNYVSSPPMPPTWFLA